jgi:CheY-like chemotaxis protein
MAGNEHPWAGERIVVLDDSVIIQEQLRQLYEGLGLEVMGQFYDGVAGLEFCRQNQVDLVSLDVMMPGMHGLECYDLLKKDKPDLFMFFVSSLTGESRFYDLVQGHVPKELFLPKPCTSDCCLRMLQMLYQSKSAENERMEPSQPPAPSSFNLP